jgi:hypothetical protein
MDVKIKDGTVEYRHPNFNCVWSIKPAENGTGMWTVSSDTGRVPDKLNGLYTGSTAAKKALESYLVNSKESATVRRDNFSAERKKRKSSNATKIQSSDG